MKRVHWTKWFMTLPALIALNGYADETASGNMAGPASGVSFAYLGDGVDAVWGYAFNATTNTVTPIECGGTECTGPKFPAGKRPLFRPATIDRSGRFAYMTNQEADDITAYAINSTTGELTRIDCGGGAECSSDNFSAGNYPGPVVLHPTERFAYVANARSDTLTVYAIDNATGALKRVDCGGGAGCKGSDFVTGKGPSSLTFHPNGKFVYVANSSDDSVSAYTINATTGAITKITCGDGEGCEGANFAAGHSSESITIVPSGKFAYVANHSDGDVTGYAINPATGALTSIDCGGGEGCKGERFAAGDNPGRVTVDPAGKFAYVANRTSSDISAYAINPASGSLAPIRCGGDAECNGSHFVTGRYPGPVTIDPSGRFAYVANESGNTLTAYAINVKTGALKRIPCRGDTGCDGTDYPVGDSPELVAIDPSGKFVYTANIGSSDLTAYTIDSGSGALKRVVCGIGPEACSGVDFGGNPVKKRLAAAQDAYEKGRFAESAKSLQWVIDQGGVHSAGFQLGYMHEIGLGVPRDVKKALGLYLQVAAGNSGAQDRIRLLYSRETDVSFMTWLEAFLRMRKGANAGSGSSEYALAFIYLYGLGVRKDEVTAVHWMRRAAANGNPHARYLLGIMAARGIGMSENADEAKALFQSAAELGSQEAAALKSAIPSLPEYLPALYKEKEVCDNADVRRQKGFPKRGQAEAFDDFRQRLRHDLVDALTNPQGDKSAQPRGFANSIDGGAKGNVLVEEIAAISKARGYVPPLWAMLELTLTATCPVGYGGKFTDDLGREVELWYVDVSPGKDNDESSVFKEPHLPAYGKVERKVFPTFLFTRDEKGRLMWYAISVEQGALLSRWYHVQFQ